MVKVKMLQHVNGKVNGVQMGPYFMGHEYNLPAARATMFIESAMAEEWKEPPVVESSVVVPSLTPADVAAIDDKQPKARPVVRAPGMTPAELAAIEDAAKPKVEFAPESPVMTPAELAAAEDQAKSPEVFPVADEKPAAKKSKRKK